MDSLQNASDKTPVVTKPDRFTVQVATPEDLVKSQTVGLVQYSDFRKRRAEALEQKERDIASQHDGRFTPSTLRSGTATPNGANSDGSTTPNEQRPKKKRKALVKGKLSFGVDDEDAEECSTTSEHLRSEPQASSKATSTRASPLPDQDDVPVLEWKRLGPNAMVSMAPRSLTKSALLKEAQTREQLRKEFLVMQEAVKATEIIIPFVFYDGTYIPGGACKIKKGEHIWLFLDRSRKVGAELGVGGSEKGSSRREWARVGVDDLMLVRGDIIIPHHYEIYYFLINKTQGPSGQLLFDYASTNDSSKIHTPGVEQEDNPEPLSVPGKSKSKITGQLTPVDNDLEGAKDDPTFTKVVDRRWFERNKHIFPASTWEEYDPGKNYSTTVRKDTEGNAFFF